MIRYPVSQQELEKLIEAESPGWLAKAAKRTESFRAKGRYEETSSIWSAVKAVYMRLQGGSKCAYCERKLEDVDLGKVEQDVEHFRPKGNIKGWRVPKKLAGQDITASPVPKAGKGYYLLPYHPFNYASACKPCNSSLKKDYFPIAGAYQLEAEDPAQLAGEQAYLVYPIGGIDDDPEQLIGFHGLSPYALASQGHKRKRALVTIEFFRLDDAVKRKNLFRDRALVVMALYPLLKNTTEGTPAEKAKAKKDVKALLKPRLAHLNCAKCFAHLFEAQPEEARLVYEKAVKLLTSMS